MNTNRTTDEIHIPIEPPMPEPQTMRFVDVHIYDYEPEPEEPPSIESQPESEPGMTNESDHHDTRPAQPRPKRIPLILLCLSSVCIVGIGAFVALSLLPLFIPDATVTIVPNTQQIRTTTRITVTTEPATGTQLQGRALAAITMNQERTADTTGKGHQDAKAASGYITFYNAATFPQTVTTGTLLTGADGVQIITDADAFLPAGTLATNGQVTVPAHALQAGPEGNIKVGDIYGSCCRENVFAANTAFTDGKQARDYQTVTQQDINTVASSLKTSLNQGVQAALQTQVHRDETLLTPFPCQQIVKPDHQPGEEAAQVNVTVSETCTGITYTTQAYQNRIIQIANLQATHQLGDGYIPIGQVQSTIIQASVQKHNQTELQITLAATYAYQVSQEQQQQLKTLIAGERKAQATNTLLHIPGIQSVSVSGDIIPTETQHIRLIVVYIG